MSIWDSIEAVLLKDLPILVKSMDYVVICPHCKDWGFCNLKDDREIITIKCRKCSKQFKFNLFEYEKNIEMS